VATILLLRRSPAQAVRALAALGVGAALWVLPLLLYQWQAFGSPFKTGYSYWNPLFDDASRIFNLSYLFSPSSPDTTPTVAYYGRMLLGVDGWFYLAPFVLAVLLGAAAVLRSKSERERHGMLLLGILALANLSIYAVYNFQYPRFVLLTATILTVLGGRGVVELGLVLRGRPSLLPGKRGWAISAILLLLVTCSLLWTGAQAVRTSYLFRAGVRHVEWYEYPWRYEVVRYLDGHTANNAIIISALPGPYVDHYLLKDTARVYMPIKHKGVYYAGKPPARAWLVADEQTELLASQIGQGTPVYMLDDPVTRQETAAIAVLRARFAFQEEGALVLPKMGTSTLYRLALAAR
jgi:hypothetical protein